LLIIFTANETVEKLSVKESGPDGADKKNYTNYSK